jgi:NAD(P)-dependent dehydrogenase (short-subunit alcohol dehydrogenase family)
LGGRRRTAAPSTGLVTTGLVTTGLVTTGGEDAVIVLLDADPDVSEVAVHLGAGLRALGHNVTESRLGTTADDVDRALVEAGSDGDGLEAVVLASAGVAGLERGDLTGLSAEQWRERVERPLERTVACFQGAHRHLAHRGGTLVVLVPTLALVGAAGYTPWATVAEGQRSMAKSAARVWGRQRITVNCVAVPGALLVPSVRGRGPVDDADHETVDETVGETVSGEAGIDRPGQPPAALDDDPQLAGAVAAVVSSLVSAGWAGVTGATIAVDGGVWMTP